MGHDARTGGRPRILLSAFACGPGHGSEPGVGWGCALAMAARAEVHVLTTVEHRADTVAVGRTVDQNVDVLQRTQHIVYRLAAQFRTAVTGLLHRNTSLLIILLQFLFFGIVLLRRLCGLAAEPAGQTEAA